MRASTSPKPKIGTENGKTSGCGQSIGLRRNGTPHGIGEGALPGLRRMKAIDGRHVVGREGKVSDRHLIEDHGRAGGGGRGLQRLIGRVPLRLKGRLADAEVSARRGRGRSGQPTEYSTVSVRVVPYTVAWKMNLKFPKEKFCNVGTLPWLMMS